MRRRAEKRHLLSRIDARVTSAETMGLANLDGKVDFTLAFAMVHEFPDRRNFFAEVARASKPGAQLLLAEPSGHVKEEDFAAELTAAAACGFSVRERTKIRRSHAVLLIKN